MIDEKEILKEIDGAISFYKRHMLNIEQTGYKYTLGYHNGRLDQLEVIRKLIKNKSAQEAATSKGTDNDINSLTQEQYNTGRKKSEIRELAVEIFDLCLQLRESADGTIDWREKGVPCVRFGFYGSTSGLQVKIWKDGFDMERRPDFSYGTLLDVRNGAGVLIACRETLIELLEERRGNDNGKDDPDHN